MEQSKELGLEYVRRFDGSFQGLQEWFDSLIQLEVCFKGSYSILYFELKIYFHGNPKFLLETKLNYENEVSTEEDQHIR